MSAAIPLPAPTLLAESVALAESLLHRSLSSASHKPDPPSPTDLSQAINSLHKLTVIRKNLVYLANPAPQKPAPPTPSPAPKKPKTDPEMAAFQRDLSRFERVLGILTPGRPTQSQATRPTSPAPDPMNSIALEVADPDENLVESTAALTPLASSGHVAPRQPMNLTKRLYELPRPRDPDG